MRRVAVTGIGAVTPLGLVVFMLARQPAVVRPVTTPATLPSARMQPDRPPISGGFTPASLPMPDSEGPLDAARGVRAGDRGVFERGCGPGRLAAGPEPSLPSVATLQPAETRPRPSFVAPEKPPRRAATTGSAAARERNRNAAAASAAGGGAARKGRDGSSTTTAAWPFWPCSRPAAPVRWRPPNSMRGGGRRPPARAVPSRTGLGLGHGYKLLKMTPETARDEGFRHSSRCRSCAWSGSDVYPTRIAPGATVRHRLTYALCPATPGATVTARLIKRIFSADQMLLVEPNPSYVLRPGNWPTTIGSRCRSARARVIIQWRSSWWSV